MISTHNFHIIQLCKSVIYVNMIIDVYQVQAVSLYRLQLQLHWIQKRYQCFTPLNLGNFILSPLITVCFLSAGFYNPNRVRSSNERNLGMDKFHCCNNYSKLRSDQFFQQVIHVFAKPTLAMTLFLYGQARATNRRFITTAFSCCSRKI